MKGPVIVFEMMFKKFGMELDWETIRKPMGKFKKEHLADILAFDHVGEQFRNAHGRDRSEKDLEEMFDMFRPTMAEVAVTEDLIRPFDGVKEAHRCAAGRRNSSRLRHRLSQRSLRCHLWHLGGKVWHPI